MLNIGDSAYVYWSFNSVDTAFVAWWLSISHLCDHQTKRSLDFECTIYQETWI